LLRITDLHKTTNFRIPILIEFMYSRVVIVEVLIVRVLVRTLIELICPPIRMLIDLPDLD